MYDIGKGTYTESYEFGRYDPDTTFRADDPYGFFDVADKTLLYGRDEGSRSTLATLRLRPDEWATALCDITGGRELTENEQAALPAPLPDQPLCH